MYKVGCIKTHKLSTVVKKNKMKAAYPGLTFEINHVIGVGLSFNNNSTREKTTKLCLNVIESHPK